MFPHAQFADPVLRSLDLIRQCRVVLCHRDSSVVVDSMACGKPPIILDRSKVPRTFPKGFFGACAVELESLLELPAHFSKARLLDVRSSDVGKYVRLGDASQLVLKAISSIIGQGGR
jgi:hypothetical protein